MKKDNQKFKRTIPLELFSAWEKSIRSGDITKINLMTKFTYPTVHKALKYGCVHNEELVNCISKYFSDRNSKENSNAKDLS